jgi:hypothetical protein
MRAPDPRLLATVLFLVNVVLMYLIWRAYP